MFKDAEEELERLQDALLSEEQDEDEVQELIEEEEEEPVLPEDFTSYNADDLDVDLEAFSDELLKKQPRSLTGLATCAVLVTLITVGFVVWWVLSRMGVL